MGSVAAKPQLTRLVWSEGQVQEEELDSCRAAGERRPGKGGMRGIGEKPKGFLPCAVCWRVQTKWPRTNPGPNPQVTRLLFSWWPPSSPWL